MELKKELKLGKVVNQELADWFGVTIKSYTQYSKRYLEILSWYCDFQKVYGGVVINSISKPVYDKTYDPKAEKEFLEEIEYCVANQDGLASVAGIARKFTAQKKYNSIKTAERNMTKAGNNLFGEVNKRSKKGEGTMGRREYIWAIKVHDLNGYRLLTPEEDELFDTIIGNYYSSNPDKIKRAALLEEEYKKSKTMTKEEYFLQKDSMGLDLFADALQLFKEQTGETIVCCSQYEINGWIKAPEEIEN